MELFNLPAVRQECQECPCITHTTAFVPVGAGNIHPKLLFAIARLPNDRKRADATNLWR